MAETQSLLNSLMDIGGEFSSVASDSFISDIAKDDYIDTGCYAFNMILSGSLFGGVAKGKVVSLNGDPATGKSYLCLSLSKSFLEKHNDGIVLYFESEGALISEQVRQILGKENAKRFLLIPVSTLEEFRDKINKMVAIQEQKEKKTPIFCVLDSLGLLSSESEVKNVNESKNTVDLTKQKTLKSIFRVLTLRLAKEKIPLVVCAHTYMSLNSYIPTAVMSGGQGLLYSSSSVIHLTRSKEKDTDGKVTGINIKCKTVKSRLTKPDRTVSVGLDFNSGLEKFSGLLELGVEALVLTHIDKKYKFPNGESAFESKIMSEPTRWFTSEILDQIEVWGQKEFKYQSSTENAVVEEKAVIEPILMEEPLVEKKRRGRPPKSV